jgi:RNA polymerase primary sigma factor
MRQLKITKSITSRESKSLEKYLQEISKVELITPAEEIKLAVLIRKGCQKSLDRLTKANLRFVVSVAKQYQNQGLSLPDLINEGNIGLIKAAQRFDETKGFKFISYAVWWVRQSILQAIAEQSRIIELPLNKIGHLGRVNKSFQVLSQRLERDPSNEELAEAVDMDIAEVEKIMLLDKRHMSLDATIGNDSGDGHDASLLDLFENISDPADEYIMKQSRLSEINDVIKHICTERQVEIIEMFFGIGYSDPMTLEDIGYKYDLTRERVRQIRDRGIKRLRSNSVARRLLGQYMG